MKYKHIVTGIMVESNTELPATVFEKVAEKAPAKKAPAKRTTKTTKKED